MTATLDSTADQSASQETSGCTPSVLVTMIRTMEKTMMTTPRHRTEKRPIFCVKEMRRRQQRATGMAMTMRDVT